jgi:hypothetical protein
LKNKDKFKKDKKYILGTDLAARSQLFGERRIKNF